MKNAVHFKGGSKPEKSLEADFDVMRFSSSSSSDSEDEDKTSDQSLGKLIL